MSYLAAHYNAVFEAMRREFGDAWYESVNPMWWNVWRRQIKERFFDEGILIREMVAALPEASVKMRWPMGTAFFQRLEDVCLKNRREARTTTRDGMKPIADLLPRNA